MFVRDFESAARNVISGAIGGLLSYVSVQGSGLPFSMLMATFGLLLILGVALFYKGMRASFTVGERHYERLNGGQPKRERQEWPEGWGS